jgi:hypothetical protein
MAVREDPELKAQMDPSKMRSMASACFGAVSSRLWGPRPVTDQPPARIRPIAEPAVDRRRVRVDVAP